MKSYTLAFISIVINVLALQPHTVMAHHSRAEFADDIQVLEGELIQVRWANPHPTFELQISNSDGTEQTLEIQAYGTIYTLSRGGVNENHFTLGEKVQIAGQISTRRENVFLANNMLLENGQEVVLDGGAEPYFNQEGLGGLANWAANESGVVDAATENLGLFRIWSQPHRNTDLRDGKGATNLHLPFNEEALSKRATWDPLNDPDMQCIPKGMPMVMATPHPFTFSAEGDNVRILAHEYAVERIIHIEDADSASLQAPNPLGYSVGRWEGDTLIVNTTDIIANYLFFGFNLSDKVEIEERITLSEDQTRLDYLAVITDPDTFTEPARIDRHWLALGETPEPYDCTATQLD
jgi:hypothetical protein